MIRKSLKRICNPAIFLALLFIALPVLAQQSHEPLELKMAAGTFRPIGPPTVPPRWYVPLASPHRPERMQYLVAIGRGPLNREQRKELEEAGAELLGYLPVHGYQLRVSEEDRAAIEALSFVAWLGELPGHFKVPPGLARRATEAGASGSGGQLAPPTPGGPQENLGPSTQSGGQAPDVKPSPVKIRVIRHRNS
jgi:hypothetical protein